MTLNKKRDKKIKIEYFYLLRSVPPLEWLLLLGIAQHGREELGVHRATGGELLAKPLEVDDILTSLLPGAEGGEAQRSLTHHVGGQPVAVPVLVQVPPEALLLPDAVDGHHQAAGEEVGEGPEHLVDFSVQLAEVVGSALEERLG